MTARRRRAGCLGWLFIGGGLYLLIDRYLGFNWLWVLLLLGVVLLRGALRRGGDRQLLLPATVLIISVGTVLAYRHGWVQFPLWKLWAVLFAAVGLGLVLTWAARSSGWWVWIPGGALLLAAGYGFKTGSFYRWQHWLRSLVDLWPVYLTAFGVVLLAGYLHKRSHNHQPPGINEDTMERR